MLVIDHQDIEASLQIIQDWSNENATNDLDWRRIHSAANILALALYKGSEALAKLRERVAEAKQELKRVEALAKLNALGLLLSGRAVLPNGQALEACSYSVARELSGTFVANDAAVMVANVDLLSAESKLIAFEQRLDALREISQGAKSTARLMQEIG